MCGMCMIERTSFSWDGFILIRSTTSFSPGVVNVKYMIEMRFSDCLLPSVDMHNQYEWQHMLPEALAIVCRCRN